MLKKILLALVVLIAAFAVYIAVQPSEFSISRSAEMAAPPADVFAQVNDFHKWQEWSPWAKLDPKAKATFDGPESGKGAGFAWDGNSEVGAGRMTITESKPNELILIKLDFLKPFEGTNNVEFMFNPKGDKTLVTWSMKGHNGFLARAACTLMNMKGEVEKQYEKGLANIKAIVEKPKT